ncbi:MAG TPA: hypothetical protein PK156_22860 [Polyangium sp.]|nr:hypothetical protein [Polyangium sp.]
MSTDTKETRISRIVLRIHGSLLVAATTSLTIASGLGYLSGQGQFAMLHSEPIGYIGLFQAYLLMASLGGALWVASFVEKPRVWHLVGILSHAAPLAANFLFWRDIERYGITHAGIAIHLSLMTLELFGWLASANAKPNPALTSVRTT